MLNDEKTAARRKLPVAPSWAAGRRLTANPDFQMP
jgi:hypothetical protein